MQTVVAKKLDETVKAWEMYRSGDFAGILKNFQKCENPEIRDLRTLAGLELDPSAVGNPSGVGLFAPLVEGMSAHLVRDYRLSASLLGGWLINKNYYTESIIRRFMDSAYHSGNWSLMFSVSKKLIEVQGYRPIAVESAFLGLYHQKKYPECVKIFEAFREHFRNTDILQKAACALIQVSRFEEAERMLLGLYQKITGTEYRRGFEEAREGWSEAIKNIGALEKKRGRTFDESMRLGLAYIFSDNYGDAMRVLKGIEPSL